MRYVIGIFLSIVALMLILFIITMLRRTNDLEEVISESGDKPISNKYSNEEIHENNMKVFVNLLFLIVLLLPLTLLIAGVFINDFGAITQAVLEFILIAIISNIYYGIRKLNAYIKRKRNAKKKEASK